MNVLNKINIRILFSHTLNEEDVETIYTVNLIIFANKYHFHIAIMPDMEGILYSISGNIRNET